jgi:hypothetical protein
VKGLKNKVMTILSVAMIPLFFSIADDLVYPMETKEGVVEHTVTVTQEQVPNFTEPRERVLPKMRIKDEMEQYIKDNGLEDKPKDFISTFNVYILWLSMLVKIAKAFLLDDSVAILV